MKKTEADEKKRPAKTFNYPKDSHGAFCKRCRAHHACRCPITGDKPADSCSL